MNEGLIPARYAKALYLVGKERNADKELYAVMKRLDSSFVEQPGLQATLSNPYVSDSDKESLLSVAAGVSDNSALFADFLKLLARNRRLDMAQGIAKAFIKLYREENGIYEVHVVSAAPLAPAEEARLKSLVQTHLKGGSMEYSSSVDPSLIGGFTVSVGNERIDASISNELKHLRLNLISN